MVTEEQSFFIDATFIFENTHKSFLGAPLFVKKGVDNTFLYGFSRDFLRLRHSLGINYGVLVIGKEAHSVTTEDKIIYVINLLNKMSIPYIYDYDESILDIISNSAPQLSNIVTQDKKLLQLVDDNVSVIFPNDLKKIDYITPSIIKSKIKVNPEHIPTYLSLTTGPKSSRLTKLQSIRLIELYGDLNYIYENFSKTPSTIKKKLTINKESFLDNYSEMRIKEHDTPLSYDIDNYKINLNNGKNTNLLKSYGFYSLTRLLKSPLKVHLNFKSNKKESNSYNAIIDSTGIKKLESLLSSSEYCAIDTEADDKDPHHATLFGVSFSVKKGEAYFVPLLENDLKDINQEDVVSFLKRVVKMQIKFIGHNIKYDYLLLRRNGINVQNIYFDTMLAAYECYGDWIFFNLKYLSHKLLGKDIKSYKEIVDREETFLELPFKKIVQHACEDADMTFRLYHVLRSELERKGLISQYFEDTIPLLIKLGGFESNGISCNLKKLEKMRSSMLTQLLNLKQNIFDNVGKTFDIDSSKELAVIINDTLKLQKFVGHKKITLSILEQLSINRHVPKLLVRYKRLQRQIKIIDNIAKSIKNKKIHPIFNQIKPPHGQISSSKPNIFNKDVISNIGICFGKEVKAFFKDNKKSLNILEDITEDSNLRKDRANKNKRNQFMANHPLMKGLNYDELLLKIIIGTHDSFLSKRFMIDKTTISTIIYDLKIRYSSLFQWIEKFQKETSIKGYASFNGKRKYLDGLKSSNIAKRKKALKDVVRWLVQY